jgi:hypothetical protein
MGLQERSGEFSGSVKGTPPDMLPSLTTPAQNVIKVSFMQVCRAGNPSSHNVGRQHPRSDAANSALLLRLAGDVLGCGCAVRDEGASAEKA